MIGLSSKFRKINNIEHNKGSKIYPQNQVILDSIMSSIPLKHKCLRKDIACSDTVFKFKTRLDKLLLPESYILEEIY